MRIEGDPVYVVDNLMEPMRTFIAVREGKKSFTEKGKKFSLSRRRKKSRWRL